MPKPRIFFACIDSPGYNSDGMVDGFSELGYDIIRFDWQRSRFNVGIEKTVETMLGVARNSRIDYIFLHIQNPEIISVESAKQFQSIAPTINYTFDVRDVQRTEWMYEIAPHITLTCFACKRDVDECLIRGIKNTMLLQSSANYKWYRKTSFYCKGCPEIVFIGNNYEKTNMNFPGAAQRQEMIKNLKETFGDRFGAYGLGQEHGIVNPQQEVNIYNAAKIAVCHNMYDLPGYESDRLWRILGCGAYVVKKQQGGELQFISFIKEALELPEYILEMATDAHKWAVSNQRWKDRFEEMFSFIKEPKLDAKTTHS